MSRSVLLALLLALPSPALACSLCNPRGTGSPAPSLRQDAAQAKLVLYGSIVQSDLNPTGGGVSQMHVLSVLKSDPSLGARKDVEIPQFIPVTNKKDPPRFIVFCDPGLGGLNPYRGVAVKSAALVEYLKGVLALDPKNRTQALQYYFRFLDHADPEVANDAYLEFAKATDQEVGQVGPKLAPGKLRRLLQDPATPAYRLGLYGFLLGACGGDPEAALLRGLVQNLTERTGPALDGLLGGYIQLRPRAGWELALAILRDEKRPFVERWAVLRTCSFYYNWKPQDSRRDVLRCLAVAVREGEIADVAIEDLRRWKLWGLTDDVLAQYGKPTHSGPLMRRAIARYALSCPRNEAQRFVAEVRKQDPELVKDVEESLQLEKKP
jgi:hypothetical protein